jgi:hypothetical protein
MPTNESMHDRALRKWFPKRYIRMMMSRAEQERQEKIKAAKSQDGRMEIEESYSFKMSVLSDQFMSIEDRELLKKAERMDLSLHDIPIPESNQNEKPSHWYESYGCRILELDSRRALQKAVRERAPAYRKERREINELIFRNCSRGWLRDGPAP